MLPWQNLSLIAGAVQKYALKIQLLEQELIQENVTVFEYWLPSKQ